MFDFDTVEVVFAGLMECKNEHANQGFNKSWKEKGEQQKGGRCQTFVASHFSFHGPVLNSLIYILAAF